MSFGKTLGMTILIYMVLNFIFAILFVALGGFRVLNFETMKVTTVELGPFFSEYLASDYIGFLCILFSPGGVFLDPIAAVNFYIVDMMAGKDKVLPVGASVIGLLWALLPGIISGFIAGSKFSEENSKTAFFGVMLGILILTIIPMVLSIAGQVTPMMVVKEHAITTFMVPAQYWPGELEGLKYVVKWAASDYVVVIVTGVLNGCLWGGFGAMSASNL